MPSVHAETKADADAILDDLLRGEALPAAPDTKMAAVLATPVVPANSEAAPVMAVDHANAVASARAATSEIDAQELVGGRKRRGAARGRHISAASAVAPTRPVPAPKPLTATPAQGVSPDNPPVAALPKAPTSPEPVVPVLNQESKARVPIEPKEGDMWGKNVEQSGVKGVKTLNIHGIAPDGTITIIEQVKYSGNGTFFENQYDTSPEVLIAKLDAEGFEFYSNIQPTTEPLAPTAVEAVVPTPDSSTAALTWPRVGETVYYQAGDGSRFKVICHAAGILSLAPLLPDGTDGRRSPATEAELTELAHANHWQSVAETAPAAETLTSREVMTKDNMQERLDALDANVNVARREFVRIEAEQAAKVNWLLKTFRTLAGKEGEIAPELQKAREDYKAALALLQSAEVERVKCLDLRGDQLRQMIAAIVREYDFQEAEQLDDDRRAKRMGDAAVPLKEKWERLRHPYHNISSINLLDKNELQYSWQDRARMLFGGTALLAELGYRGVKTVGEKYNQLTKTRTGKITTMAVGAAGAATLTFATGGAALGLAGVVLAAKRAAAGAGVALVADEGMAIVARKLRAAKSQKLGEDTAKELLAAAKREAVETYANTTDLNQSPPGEVGLSDKALQAFERFLKSQTLDNFGERDRKRKRGSLWRKSSSMFLGATIGSGALGQMIGAGANEAVAQVRGSGAVGEAARVIERAASGASAAASAAEASASTPASAAAAATLSEKIGSPGQEEIGLAPGELPNALNQDRLAKITVDQWNGTPTDTMTARPPVENKIGGVLGERTVARGDTVWKYGVEAAKTAGLDPTSQQRFSGALTQALREKLSMVTPAEAAKYGFYLNPDGILTPDYIRAEGKLDIAGFLGQEKMNVLLDQAQAAGSGTAAQQAVESGASQALEERAIGVPRADIEADPKQWAEGKAADWAPGEIAEAGTQTGNVEMVVEAKSAVSVGHLNSTAALLDHLRTLPQIDQINLFRSGQATLHNALRTEFASLVSDNYNEAYDPSLHKEFGKLSAERVLADYQGFREKLLYFPDQKLNPLHITQIQEIGKLAEAAGKVMGDKQLIRPFSGETLEQYCVRLNVLAHVSEKKIPGLRVVN